MVKKVLELCDNYEALRLYCGLDWSSLEDDPPSLEAACDAFLDALWSQLEQLGYSVSRPGRQRGTCHGWNGARFSYRYKAVGTVYFMTGRNADEIERVVDACYEAALLDHSVPPTSYCSMEDLA